MNGSPRLVVLLVLVCACVPDLSSQPLRRDYLREKMDANAAQSFGCEKVEFQFGRTEQRSGAWFDYYLAAGCGGTSDYVTQLQISDKR